MDHHSGFSLAAWWLDIKPWIKPPKLKKEFLDINNVTNAN